jgi:chromosome partitioning protein
MGKIVVFGGRKGGTGKSTCAVNAAVMRKAEGVDVLLVDCDPQMNAMKWVAARSARGLAPRIPCVSVYGPEAGAEIAGLAGRYEDVVVDCRGADSVELRSAMAVARMLVSPIRPSQFDIDTVLDVSRICALMRTHNPTLDAVILFNMVSTHPASREVDDAASALEDLTDMRILPRSLRHRKAFALSAQGIGVTELQGREADPKALAEMSALSGELWK